MLLKERLCELARDRAHVNVAVQITYSLNAALDARCAGRYVGRSEVEVCAEVCSHALLRVHERDDAGPSQHNILCDFNADATDANNSNSQLRELQAWQCAGGGGEQGRRRRWLKAACATRVRLGARVSAASREAARGGRIARIRTFCIVSRPNAPIWREYRSIIPASMEMSAAAILTHSAFSEFQHSSQSFFSSSFFFLESTPVATCREVITKAKAMLRDDLRTIDCGPRFGFITVALVVKRYTAEWSE